MLTRKISFFVFLSLFLASGLLSQSLAEFAQREKARRESLKDAKTVVITNETLRRLTKTPGITVSLPETEVEAQQETPAEGTIPPVQAQPLVNPGSPAPVMDQAREQEAGLLNVYGIGSREIEERHRLARDLVDLLTLKMNALYQQFYNQADMAIKEEVQRQISETYAKLLKAQEDEGRAREELERALTRIKK